MDATTQTKLPQLIRQVVDHLAWHTQDVAALVAHEPREARHSTSLSGVRSQLAVLCGELAVPIVAAECTARSFPVLEKLRRILSPNDLGTLRANRDRSERELLGLYETVLECPLPLSVATSLLRQHDALKRAAHARCSAAVRRLAGSASPQRAPAQAAHAS